MAGGKPDPSTFPQTIQVDYVRVWDTKGKILFDDEFNDRRKNRAGGPGENISNQDRMRNPGPEPRTWDRTEAPENTEAGPERLASLPAHQGIGVVSTTIEPAFGSQAQE